MLALDYRLGVRLTEFWERMEQQFGRGYAQVWAEEHRLAGLDHHTVAQALAGDTPYKTIWRAVWAELELPDSER